MRVVPVRHTPISITLTIRKGRLTSELSLTVMIGTGEVIPKHMYPVNNLSSWTC